MEELSVRHSFCLGRFAASDDDNVIDIRFFTRFVTYSHIMAFWRLIKPATNRMVRVTRAKAATRSGEVGATGNASGHSLMSADEVRKTQSIARLRVHVEGIIRRVKQHKLFDAVIPLSITRSINQLYTVALPSCQLPEWALGKSMGNGLKTLYEMDTF